MKVTFSDQGFLRVDLSDEPQEVSNYLLDQLPDRVSELMEHEHSIETDHEKQFVEVSIPILDLIYRIVEEKEHDIEYEKKHAKQEEGDTE